MRHTNYLLLVRIYAEEARPRAPFRACPIWAKFVMVVVGSETNPKPSCGLYVKRGLG
jgi:hypothetical protein